MSPPTEYCLVYQVPPHWIVLNHVLIIWIIKCTVTGHYYEFCIWVSQSHLPSL